MMILLVILCMLMILFAGGCALAAFGAGVWPVAVIPAGIVVANVLVIQAVRGLRKPDSVGFVILAALDFMIGGPMLGVLFVDPAAVFTDSGMLATAAVATAIVVKGVLTVLALMGLRQGREEPSRTTISS